MRRGLEASFIDKNRILPADDILFLPLGGAGEIGMNMYLYGYKEQWLIVDFGMGFANDDTPNVHLIFPDIQFLERHKDLIQGIVITHAHEDHIGALPYLWEAIKCPMWMSPFAANLVMMKNEGRMTNLEHYLNIVEGTKKVEIGHFKVEFIPMTHSIPENHALLIETAGGRILHSGDWNLDDNPPIGMPSSLERMAQIGEAGIDALVCDSTNVFSKKREGSESVVANNLATLIASFKDERIIATCFASNVARMRSIALAAEAAGRYCVLLGRSMTRYETVARQSGYLTDVAPFLSEYDAQHYDAHELLYLCTGSQGEEGAAMARLAEDTHRLLYVEKGDIAIFSSRLIPGNEHRIAALQNLLLARGVEVINADECDELIHVSGHPSRDELAQLYNLLKPPLLIPIHGELRHLREQADFAKECGMGALIVTNGDIAKIGNKTAEKMTHVHAGRLGLYGNRILRFEHPLIHRHRADTKRGTAVFITVFDQEGQLLHEPTIAADALMDMSDEGDRNAARQLVSALVRELTSLTPEQRLKDEKVRRRMTLVGEELFDELFELRPLIDVRIIRV